MPNFLNIRTILLGITMVITSHFTFSQGEVDFAPIVNLNDGMGLTRGDSLFKINFRFRMQNRAEFFSNSAEDLRIKEVDARVRRLRLRMDGFIKNPKFAYYIQLSFSRGDQDFEDTGVPNVVRDAMFFYYINPKLYMGFGQGKLPGNRQRMTSSGQQQFAERSIANAYFNIDRDFGWFVNYTVPLGKMIVKSKSAISTGEGRNQIISNGDFAYTSRVEWLPLGEFKNSGDYSEGDLEQHDLPKISLAASYHYNQAAVKTRGQTGKLLFEERPLTSFIADFLFKYKGFALSSEYLSRSTTNPYTQNFTGTDYTFVYVGKGVNAQGSYLFKNSYEVCTRYSTVIFDNAINTDADNLQMISLGANKYLNQHRVKLQSNVSYHIKDVNMIKGSNGNRWSLMFQIELGI